MKGTKKKSKKKNSALALFVWFTVIAIVSIVVLEYLDYQKGEKSFIFTRLFPLENRDQKISLFNEKLVAILKNNTIPFDYFQDEKKVYHFKMDIEQAHYEKLVTKIKAVATNLKGELVLAEIQGMAYKSIMLFHVKLGQKLSHVLLISRINLLKPPHEVIQPVPEQEIPKPVKKIPAPVTKEPEYVSRTPRIAIIIDDVGAYDIGPLELKRLQIPITLSILPDSNFAADAVYWAQEYQLETLIHLPLQPNNSNGQHVNRKQEIRIDSSDDEIRALIRHAKQVVPQASGCNSHQGSLITASPGIMLRVLKIIKQEGLFFIDSRTIATTVAFKLAKQLGIPTTHKDVFIDHIQTYESSMAQIRILVDLARQNGKAVAIGHPFGTTLRAIRDSVGYIRAKGVEIVLAKELLE